MSHACIFCLHTAYNVVRTIYLCLLTSCRFYVRFSLQQLNYQHLNLLMTPVSEAFYFVVDSMPFLPCCKVKDSCQIILKGSKKFFRFFSSSFDFIYSLVAIARSRGKCSTSLSNNNICN